MGLFGMVILLIYYFTESMVIEEPESEYRDAMTSNGRKGSSRGPTERLTSPFGRIST